MQPAPTTWCGLFLAAAKRVTIRQTMYIPVPPQISATGDEQGILRQDSLPSVYAYSQRFSGSPAPATRNWSAMASSPLDALRITHAGIVFRHEQTLAKPKADRLDLLRATRAHFGQIFMLYEDSGEVESLLATSRRTGHFSYG